MLAIRVTMLALMAVVACASLAHAIEEPQQDIDNNEVLPENDVVKARVDELPVTTIVPDTTPSSGPDTTPTPTVQPPEGSTTPEDAPAPATEAPAKPPSSLAEFLSGLIQFPLAVLRSVGGMLSNTFSSARRPAAAATATPLAA